MLKQHPSPAPQNPISAAAPPTTQEIAQAIAALEARKTTLNNNAVQTNTVSEIIDNLGLDMTADDVLAEVRAQRARTTRKGFLSAAKHLRLATAFAVIASALVGWYWAGESPVPQDAAPPAAIAPMAYVSPPQHLALTSATLVSDTTGRTATLRTLGEIPDNHPVQCGITGSGTPTTTNMDWTLVKHNGQVYLRCWTVPMSTRAMSEADANGGLVLFPGRNGTVGNSRATAPLTLPAKGFTLPPDNYSVDNFSLNARNVRLDSHAYEKWNP